MITINIPTFFPDTVKLGKYRARALGFKKKLVLLFLLLGQFALVKPFRDKEICRRKTSSTKRSYREMADDPAKAESLQQFLAITGTTDVQAATHMVATCLFVGDASL